MTIYVNRKILQAKWTPFSWRENLKRSSSYIRSAALYSLKIGHKLVFFMEIMIKSTIRLKNLSFSHGLAYNQFSSYHRTASKSISGNFRQHFHQLISQSCMHQFDWDLPIGKIKYHLKQCTYDLETCLLIQWFIQWDIWSAELAPRSHFQDGGLFWVARGLDFQHCDWLSVDRVHVRR